MGKAIAIRNNFMSRIASRTVSYLSPEEVSQIADCVKDGRNGERNYLLILLLFQTGLRVSEGLSLTPSKITRYNNGYIVKIVGKGNKPRTVATPELIANKLIAFAYNRHLGPNDRIFDINRKSAWRIIKQAGRKAGIEKRIYPHLLRHADAIERLRQTHNPKALQLHLGHNSILMSMRYLSTLSEEAAIKEMQTVQF